MAIPKAFYSYMENEDKLNMLSDEQAGRLYKSLYAYCRTGEKPDFSDDPLLNYAFADFLIDIERDRDRYEKTCARRKEAGKLGGAPKGNKNAEKSGISSDKNNQKQAKQPNGSENNQKQPKTSKTSESEAEAEAEANTTNVVKEKNKKEKYGEFDNVQLTKEEFEKLKAAFPSDWRDRIERLSQYLAQTGKRYKSHYATILSWARRDREEKPPDKKPPDKRPGWRRGSMYSAEGASFDLSQYEKAGLFND